MMRIFGRTVEGARGFANKRRSAGSQVDRRGRKFGSLFIAAFAGLSAATATPAAAGCQTTTTSVTASPATLNTGSATQTLSLSATGTLSWDFDGAGAGSSIIVATLQGVSAFSASDIFIL